MSFNPYKILGIKKSSSREEIRTAYIELAKLHHPDVNGDAEKFKEIQGAYDLLMNEQHRAAYDQSGFVPGDPDSQRRQAAMNNLMDMFSQLLDQMPEQDLDRVDIPKIIIDASNNALSAHIKRLSDFEKQEGKITRQIEKIKRRLRKKNRAAPNFLLMAAEGKLGIISQQKLQPTQLIAIIKESLKMLGDFEYEFDKSLPAFVSDISQHDIDEESISPEQFRRRIYQSRWRGGQW